VKSSAAATGGKNGMVLNFVASAAPMVSPTHAALVREGLSSSAVHRHSARRNAATKGTSVVANPACATIPGMVATRHAARAAIRGLFLPPLNTHVSSTTTQRKSRFATRAVVTLVR
jgi:hypothetical protein